MPSKKDIFTLGAVVVIFAIIFSQAQVPRPNLTAQSNQTQPNNVAVAAQPVVYDVSKVNWLPWIGMGALVLWVIWKEKKKSQGKPYTNMAEAVEDVKNKAASIHIMPISFESVEFTNPETKIEVRGLFSCSNPMFPYTNRPIPFSARKNGVFRYDATKLYPVHPKPRQDKIQIGEPQKQEKK